MEHTELNKTSFHREELIMIPVDDPVNHPAHYTAGGIEVIDFLEAWNFPFHLANAIKYICRAGRKDKSKTAEDLRKAQWYLNRYIEYLRKQEDKT